MSKRSLEEAQDDNDNVERDDNVRVGDSSDSDDGAAEVQITKRTKIEPQAESISISHNYINIFIYKYYFNVMLAI
jgi:hypothetical protein